MKRPLADPAPDPADSPAHLSPGTAASEVPPDVAEDTEATVRDVVAAALDKQAEDLKVLQVGAVTDFTDFFLVCSGQSSRQVQAIADGVEERLRARKRRPLHVEGYQSGQWVLMDYGDVVLHVFLHERRRFYGLERLWGDAPDRTAELGGEVAERGQDQRGPGPQRH
jgi:ribosome-associated protein